MLLRAEQKQQTRHALLDAARSLMESGRGFGSLSLREVAKAAGIVPTGFYRHFEDMDQLGLTLVCEVGETFRETIRLVRHNTFVATGIIDASVKIFLEVVAANRSQFLFLAREQYGGSLQVRQAHRAPCAKASPADLAADLTRMPKLAHLQADGLHVMADLIVKSVFATLPDIIDPPAHALPETASRPRAKITQQLRFIFIGANHWQGLGSTE
ncbi:TetR family transcriptional regulator [Pseudomonas sp. RTB3]|nr:TetR family transcriptional regulator [Pseudomonas sp. RTB3]